MFFLDEKKLSNFSRMHEVVSKTFTALLNVFGGSSKSHFICKGRKIKKIQKYFSVVVIFANVFCSFLLYKMSIFLEMCASRENTSLF